MTTHKLTARRGERIENRERLFNRTRTMAQMKAFRKLLFGISPRETNAAVRGFPKPDSPMRARLEDVGKTFVQGYSTALESPDPAAIELALELVPKETRGFAYEGAAMSLGLLDHLTPWNRKRFARLLQSSGADHAYMLYVGLGWARARLKVRRSQLRESDDPLLGWLVFDGFGFHEGFFDWKRCFVRKQRTRGITGVAARVFDQGLGRCAWFVFGADVGEITASFQSFDPERHEDLWGGVGLAAAYAGGVSSSELAELALQSGENRRALAQGAAFAAQARRRAGNEAEHTERACREFSGASAREAAELTELVQETLPRGGSEPAYLVWRQRIREQL